MTNTKSSLAHLTLCCTTEDFEVAAKEALPEKSWVYVSSSTNSGASHKANLDDWSRINFRPRIMRSVSALSTTQSILLGQRGQYPFFVSAMGTLGSVHTGAEPLLVRGATRKGFHTVVSTATTKPLEEIMDAHMDEQRQLHDQSPSRLFFQLYMPVDREKAKSIIQRVKAAGYKSLWVTVDTSTLGKRTADRYLQAQEALAQNGQEMEWSGPIVLKGIQSVEDVKLALQHGVQGVLLSNHGGRQIHSGPSALMTLLEIRTYYPEAFDRLEVFVDGGLRDGADVLKALCLGATAVGVGRPYYYALTAYGIEGIERCTDILAEELEITMRMLGVASLDQLQPDMVNSTRLLNDMWRPDAWRAKL